MRSIRSPRIHLAGIFGVLALFGAGCGGGGSHSIPAGGDGYASFAWDIYDIQDTTYRTRLTCASVGAASVVVTLTNLQTGTVYNQSPVSCSGSNMEMSTAYVPAGSYTVGFALYGDPAIYGNALTILDSFDMVDSSGATSTFSILSGLNDFRSSVAAFVTQSFVLGWGISYQGAPTTCGAMYAAAVDLDVAVEGSSTWVTSRFNCTTGAGTSYAIPFYNPTTGQPATTVQWRLYLVDQTGQDIASVAGGTVGIPAYTDIDLGKQYFSF
jgi:hypothetical protein